MYSREHLGPDPAEHHANIKSSAIAVASHDPLPDAIPLSLPYGKRTLSEAVSVPPEPGLPSQANRNAESTQISTKRRKVDSFEIRSGSGIPPFVPRSGDNISSTGLNEQPLEDWPSLPIDGSELYWPFTPIPSFNSHEAMAYWNWLLCSCPDVGWENLHGYAPLIEASQSQEDVSRPYDSEKMPFMPMNPPYSESCTSHLIAGLNTSGEFEPALLEISSCSYNTAQGAMPSAAPILNEPDSSAFSTHHMQPSRLPNTYIAPNSQFLEGPTAAFEPSLLENTLPSLEQSHYPVPTSMLWQTTFHGMGINSDIPVLGALPTIDTGVERTAAYDLDDFTVQNEILRCDLPVLPGQYATKRGPFKDMKLRKQTAETRRVGSCIRCRMQRIRCESDPANPRGICRTCMSVGNPKSGRFPCLRYKLTDVKLYKPGQVPGHEWTRRWANGVADPIKKWASPEVKTIYVSAGYSRIPIQLQVRRFLPQDGDKLVRTWMHAGRRRTVEVPPFALIDLSTTKLLYSCHIQDIMMDAIHFVVTESDELLRTTYYWALRMRQHPSTSPESAQLLHLMLTLWVSVRLTTKSCFIVGSETLGMARDIFDHTCPDAGKIPIPPVLGAQLDLILIHYIQSKLRREALELFQKIVLKNKQANWFVTYLVTFILLHNTSLITAHDAGYARKHGMHCRFAREEKVREYHLGANILLAHFHYCNKGTHPFSDECRDNDLRMLGDLDCEQVGFVHATRECIRQRKQDWYGLRQQGSYEDNFFFISQLFDAEWKPLSTI